jgi:hypothetical protein
VAGSLGNAITSGLGSLTMHARGGGGTSGSGGGTAGGIVSSRSNSNNNDGGGGASSRHHVVHHVQQNPTSSTSSSSSPPSQQQQQQSSSSSSSQPPLTRRRDSHSSSTRYKSSAQSVVSIGSTSVFSPSIIGTSVRSGNGGGGNGGGGGQNELQPSSARLLRDLNKSAQSSLLSSLGTAAASRTFRSYKMMLPRYVPRMAMMTATNTTGGGPDEENEDKGNATTTAPPIETDLELLGRTVHAVSSALTEPPRVGDRYMIYDVSFNPRGCVWDASVVVYDDEEEEEEEDEGDEKRTTKKNGSSGGGGSSGTFTFPIRVTCAEDEDDDYDDDLGDGEQDGSGGGGTSSRPRAKTYAVELSIIDDTVHNLRNAADHRDDIKNSVEWISYGIRRSMARSMFPQFPEGCRGRPFREVYQLNKKVRTVVHRNERAVVACLRGESINLVVFLFPCL